jgi:hypothetical protein
MLNMIAGLVANVVPPLAQRLAWRYTLVAVVSLLLLGLSIVGGIVRRVVRED